MRRRISLSLDLDLWLSIPTGQPTSEFFFFFYPPYYTIPVSLMRLSLRYHLYWSPRHRVYPYHQTWWTNISKIFTVTRLQYVLLPSRCIFLTSIAGIFVIHSIIPHEMIWTLARIKLQLNGRQKDKRPRWSSQPGALLIASLIPLILPAPISVHSSA